MLGPLFVIIGAGLWGTETFFRVYLNTKFDSEVLVFHEHLFCIAFTLPLALFYMKDLSKPSKTAWLYLLGSGVIGSALGTTFFTMALNVMNSSVANVLLNFQPLVSVLFAQILLNEHPGKKFFWWAAVALGAGLLLAGNGFNFHLFTLNVGFIYIAITALSWGFSTVAGRRAMQEIPLTIATAARFVIGATALLTSLLLKNKFTPDQLKWPSLMEPEILKNFLFLSVVSGVIPLYFYFKGLSKTSASVSGFCELTQTFSALILTWGVLGQALSITQVAAGLVLLGAVYMVNLNYHQAN